MALNQINEEMDFGAITNRRDHVTVVWNGMTLVWGGSGTGYRPAKWCDPEIVYCYLDGNWLRKKTRGDVPPPTATPAAGIIGDELFIACGYYIKRIFEEGANLETVMSDDIYKLDLNQWKWSKLEPGGTKPLKSGRMASWVFGEKLFLFGGDGGDTIEGQTYP